MEGRTENHTPKTKNMPKKFQEMFENEPRKKSPKPSTSKEPSVPNQESPPEMTVAEPISNSYLFSKNRHRLSLLADPLRSNSSFLYHCFDDKNTEVPMYNNREQQALGKLIKNYLEDDNEEDTLLNPSPQLLHPSSTRLTEQSRKSPYLHPIQKQPSFCNTSRPMNTKILSPLQSGRTENETLSRMPSSLKPEIYNSDPFGNNYTEREHLRQSIIAASQKYESALKILENVIDRLGEPWPGRKKRLKENNYVI